MITKISTKSVSLVIVALMLTQITACGYFMYPERRGQTSGKVDPAVVIMDGIGLLFFIIPGVIAFAVDYSSGAIYLPPEGRRSSLKDSKVVKLDDLSNESITRAIKKYTGKVVNLNDKNVLMYEI